MPGLKRDWIPGLLLVLAVVLVYLPVGYAGFIWDDDMYITANPSIVGPLGLREIWTVGYPDISPLTTTTFWLEHAVWGLTPGLFHLVNVCFHAACAVALWQVLRGLRVPGAWFGAALWALHPVQVESVAWISELKNPESGLFFLLSIFFFVRWFRDKRDPFRFDWNYATTLVFATLAMASKSSTVILPIVLCLCAWWIEGRWRWRNLAITAPFTLLSIIASFFSLGFEKSQIATLTDLSWQRTWPERFISAGDAIWFYLGKLLWPHPLMAIYPRWHLAAESGISYLPLAAVVALLLFLWTQRETWMRPVFFVFAYFLVALFPVLGFAENTIFQYSFVFDHFQYLASMGPLALIGAGIVRLTENGFPGRRALQSVSCAVPLLVLAYLTWQRSGVYIDSTTLWTDSLAKNPDCWVGHYNLGNDLWDANRKDDAAAQYRISLAQNPRYAKAHNNLGVALLQMGRTQEAIAEFKLSQQCDPTYADPQINLQRIGATQAK